MFELRKKRKLPPQPKARLENSRSCCEHLLRHVRLVLLERLVEHARELRDLGLEAVVRRPRLVRVEDLRGHAGYRGGDGEVETAAER